MINVAHYGLAVSLPGNPNAPITQNPKTLALSYEISILIL